MMINRPPIPFGHAGTSSAIGGEAPPPLLHLSDPHFNGLDFMNRTFDNRIHKDISGQGPPILLLWPFTMHFLPPAPWRVWLTV
ncbi:hypothetical protein, partial [Bradyrhizobium sp. TM233]|uniref:hypothetical protein n=1 Tax=Bradyrhizobium sp. TM233 TaxID=2599801 RepID=UPI0030C6613B